MKSLRLASWVVVAVCLNGSAALAQKPTQVPPGMFKDLNDAILGDALIIRDKQLFIDDYLIEELRGTMPTSPQGTEEKPGNGTWERGSGRAAGLDRLGRAMAEALLRAGATVVMNGSNAVILVASEAQRCAAKRSSRHTPGAVAVVGTMRCRVRWLGTDLGTPDGTRSVPTTS